MEIELGTSEPPAGRYGEPDSPVLRSAAAFATVLAAACNHRRGPRRRAVERAHAAGVHAIAAPLLRREPSGPPPVQSTGSDRVEAVTRIASAHLTADSAIEVGAPDGSHISLQVTPTRAGLLISIAASTAWAKALSASIPSMQARLARRGLRVASWSVEAAADRGSRR